MVVANNKNIISQIGSGQSNKLEAKQDMPLIDQMTKFSRHNQLMSTHNLTRQRKRCTPDQ